MVYTKWDLVCNPLSCVYFGDLFTEILHFSPLKSNNSAQLGTPIFRLSALRIFIFNVSKIFPLNFNHFVKTKTGIVC